VYIVSRRGVHSISARCAYDGGRFSRRYAAAAAAIAASEELRQLAAGLLLNLVSQLDALLGRPLSLVWAAAAAVLAWRKVRGARGKDLGRVVLWLVAFSAAWMALAPRLRPGRNQWTRQEWEKNSLKNSGYYRSEWEKNSLY
jgi:hypothetical protein